LVFGTLVDARRIAHTEPKSTGRANLCQWMVVAFDPLGVESSGPKATPRGMAHAA
jgi:hypothetical protein